MKRCPKCNANYFDNMLEFCLEDGNRLVSAVDPTTQKTYPIVAGAKPGPLDTRPSKETVVIPKVNDAVSRQAAPAAFADKSVQVLTFAPLVIALAHNWWQWVYLEKVYIYSITEFLLSANFLMWMLLLVAGLITGLFSLRRSENRTAAVIALVTLAINFILYLVPRR